MGRRRSLKTELAGFLLLVVLGLVGLALQAVVKFVEVVGLPGIVGLLVLGGLAAGSFAWGRRLAARSAEAAARERLRAEEKALQAEEKALRAEEERRWRALGEMSIDQLDQLSGRDFERWAAKRLREAGFEVELTPASGDFGVDLIAVANGVRFGVQAKRWQGPVGNRAVQAVTAGCDYFGCEIGAVVTTSRFTKAAAQQAKRSRRKVLLVGRGDLPEVGRLLWSAVETECPAVAPVVERPRAVVRLRRSPPGTPPSR